MLFSASTTRYCAGDRSSESISKQAGRQRIEMTIRAGSGATKISTVVADER
jgi:hypothetical protein